MRYLTWKLNWDGNYGTGPEPVAAANGGRLEASSWVNPTVEAGTIMGYLTGDMDVTLFAAFDGVEITEAEALAFAQGIDENAFVAGGGVVGTTTEIDFEAI